MTTTQERAEQPDWCGCYQRVGEPPFVCEIHKYFQVELLRQRLEEAKDLEFLASGCVQTRERIVDAIRKHRADLERQLRESEGKS